MPTHIRFRQGWRADLSRSAEMQTALSLVAQDVADEAQSLGRSVSSTYTAEVDRSRDGVRVEANSEHINPAAWIEFGTGGGTPTPAHAPLRRAAEAVGLKTARAQR